jgi:hypothetical protein
LEARKFADTDEKPIDTAPRGPDTTVVSLTQRRLTHLPPDTRPLPSVAAYDQLLRHRRPTAEGTTP